MAVVLAIDKWRPYLIGRRFKIRTDHVSLKYLMEQRIITPSQQKWLSKLLGYDFEMEYKSGGENIVADALSRMYCTMVSLRVSSLITTELVAEIQASCIADINLQKKMTQLQQNADPKGKYTCVNGQLRRKGKLVVGANTVLKSKIMNLIHCSPVGGHSGSLVTYKKIAELVYWKGMHKDVRNFVRSCDTCQLNKYDPTNPVGLLQPLPIPERIWDEVSMDFIEGLPSVYGKTVILVVVDRLSKSAHFIPLKHPYTAEGVAKAYLDHVYKLHGMPKSIVSDRDPVFTSLFWKELFKLRQVKLKFSSAYHPQTDGQTEVVNRCLETYLRCMCTFKPKEWLDYLPLAEWWYNTNFHSSLQSSPYEVLLWTKTTGAYSLPSW